MTIGSSVATSALLARYPTSAAGGNSGFTPRRWAISGTCSRELTPAAENVGGITGTRSLTRLRMLVFPRGGVAIDGRGEPLELVPDVGRERRVQPRDLRVEERAHRLPFAEGRADGRVPQHGRSRRARGGQPLAHGRDVVVGQVADRVRQ